MNNFLLRFRKNIAGVLAWSFLRGIQNYRIVKSTYIWLFVLPVVAKLFSQLESTLRMNFYGQEVVLDVELPFAWIMLFYSALLFTVGNLIYILGCPAIIKENRSIADFKATMKTPAHLVDYMTEKQRNEWNDTKDEFTMRMETMVGTEIAISSVDREKSEFFDAEFWNIYNQQNIFRLPVRVVVLTVYVIAACCFSSVLYQNIYYVLTQL